MQTREAAVDALAGIDDATLLSAGKDKIEEEAYRRLERISFDGIALRGPSRVDLSKQTALPILIAAEQDAGRSREVPLGINAAVVVLRAGSSDLGAVPAFADPMNKIPLPEDDPQVEPPPPPRKGAETERGLGVQWVNLRAAEGLRWEPGRYVIRIIDWDWTSNAQSIIVADGEKISPARPARARLNVEPGSSDSLPNYVRTRYSPELGEPGIALALPDRRVNAGAPIPAYGSLRLNADPDWIETANDLWAIPVRLLLARLGVVNPIVVELEVPVFSPGEEAQAFFALDLRASAPRPLPVGTYQVYLLAGDHLSGPHPLELAP